MSKKNKESSKNSRETVIKICIFSDYEEKNKNFISNYSKGRDTTNKTDTIEINKPLLGRPYRIIFHTTTNADERLVSYVQENTCVFILFDMSDRSSFDNLLDKWLIWLRDACKYEGKIVIFGEFEKSNNENEFFLSTSDDEVDEVIKCAELKQTLFLRIGDMSFEDRIAKIDDVIATAMPPCVDEPQKNQGGSFDKCIIV